MCFFPPAMNNSLLVAPCITSRMAFSQALEDATLNASGCELTHNVQKHMDCAELRATPAAPTCHPSPGSARPLAFCLVALWHAASSRFPYCGGE